MIMNGTSCVAAEAGVELFRQDRGRERTERLAVLDARVERGLHVGPSRVAEDAAVAKCARTPFLPALEPTHDPTLGESVRGLSTRVSRVSRSNGMPDATIAFSMTSSGQSAPR